MKKRVLFLLLVGILFFPIISSAQINSEIQKITTYAEDYETGNINYVQLLVYTSSIREKMNDLLGASGKENGGILKQQQIESVLGEPNERTKWVWVEGLEHEVKLNTDVPAWRKIIFDGKKIQIRLNAYPSILVKTDFKTEEEKAEFRENGLEELSQKQFTENDVIYRLNIEISFKKPQDQLDMAGKIDDIQTLAQDFNSDPSSENAEELAKAGVDAEKLFWSYFEQSSGKCETLMSSIFGSENKRDTQNLLVQEIDFYSGEDFQAVLRLEMCDDCEWNWINLDMRLDTRGRIKLPEGTPGGESYSKEKYKSMSNEEFQSEISELLDEIKESLAEKDFHSALSDMNELRMLNTGWNEKANNIWQEMDEIYRQEEQAMADEERQKLNENYGWIKREQERRQKEKEVRKQNYEGRKQFYLNLFSGSDKSEFYYTQIEFEKRLVEEFMEFGEEICDNNQDDNENENIDCSDSQCGGKFCGKQSVSVTEGNKTTQGTVDLYCIAGTCQAREEIIEEQIMMCGNHICELNETIETCAEDCSACQTFDAINCSGKVIFSGMDINNCPLQPVCIEESNFCNVTEDCLQPLCGEVACIQGECELTELIECAEAQCNEGGQKIIRCDTGEELVNSICTNGIWDDLEIGCFSEGIPETEEILENETTGRVIEEEGIILEEELLGNACSIKEDCGNINDVCSNGRCVTLPEAIKIEQPEIIEQPETPEEQPSGEGTEEPPQEEEQESPPEQEGQESESESLEEQSQEPPATGSAVLDFLGNMINNFVLTITGFQVEGEESTEEITPEENIGETIPDQDSGQPGEQQGPPPSEGESPPENPENFEEVQQEEREDEREDEERDRRKDECGDQCNRMCYDSKIRPCVEKCIRESCGDSFECDIDAETQGCETGCKDENNIDECVGGCVPKCISGDGDWWKEFEMQSEQNQPQMEKGVFNVGGGCRTSQGKTEGFIWFGGWGDPFERIEPLKQKYYTGGQTEWCNYDLENLKKQRAEFEKGFNQEFIEWFFEDYLANSAEDWEQHVSGIFEVYWKNVDNIRETANRMGCLEIDEFSDYNLISVQYESEYGKIEFWEELKTVKMPELDNKEVTIITPYMKFWIFPPKRFIEYEMKKSMASGEFPGSPEDKRERETQEGLTEEEKQAIKQNQAFMNKITEISRKYNGNFDLVVQLKNFETNEIVYNIYAQVNEDDIIKMQPMLPDQIPSEDARIEINFQDVYDVIYSIQSEMQGERIESPPWDRKSQGGGIKGITNGINMYFKVRDILNSAEVYPEESEKDVRDLVKTFLKMMMQEGGDNSGEKQMNEEGEGEETSGDEDVWNSFEEGSEK